MIVSITTVIMNTKLRIEESGLDLKLLIILLCFVIMKKMIKNVSIGIIISDKENGNIELIFDDTEDIYL